MANLADYVLWRGDVPLSVSPFNDIDALVLCQLSYLNFDNLLPSDFTHQVSVAKAAELFASAPDFAVRSDVGAMINKATVPLLASAGKTVRFGNMTLCGYVNKIDLSKEEQFAAFTVNTADGAHRVVYRGTDDTIVGWKEDFNMGFLDEVPAQTDAASYFEKAASALKGTFSLAGHSKGGNLAVYAASVCGAKLQSRIAAVYNMDGPGFNQTFLKSGGFQSVKPRLCAFYPQMSIVGMLFDHAENYTVVESDAQGIHQHDPFSWHVLPAGFVTLPETEGASRFLDKTLNTWFAALSREQRELFVESLFGLLKATNASTNSELVAGGVANSARIVKAFMHETPETRDAVRKIVQVLFRTAKENIPGVQRTGKKTVHGAV